VEVRFHALLTSLTDGSKRLESRTGRYNFNRKPLSSFYRGQVSSWGKVRLARKADNLPAICEPNVERIWQPRHITNPLTSTACYRDSFTFSCKKSKVAPVLDKLSTRRSLQKSKVVPVLDKLSTRCSLQKSKVVPVLDKLSTRCSLQNSKVVPVLDKLSTRCSLQKVKLSLCLTNKHKVFSEVVPVLDRLSTRCSLLKKKVKLSLC
jgi:hypothetical protein